MIGFDPEHVDVLGSCTSLDDAISAAHTDERRAVLVLPTWPGVAREHLAAATAHLGAVSAVLASGVAVVAECLAAHAAESHRIIHAALERHVLDLVRQLAGVGPADVPLPDTSQSPRAHRAMIHARYLARRSVREQSTSAHPGTVTLDKPHDLALVLAFAAEYARSLAAELADVDPITAEHLAALVAPLDDLVLALTHLGSHGVTSRRRCSARSLSPPGRAPLARHLAAHAPPRSGVCHARSHGLYRMTSPGPP